MVDKRILFIAICLLLLQIGVVSPYLEEATILVDEFENISLRKKKLESFKNNRENELIFAQNVIAADSVNSKYLIDSKFDKNSLSKLEGVVDILLKSTGLETTSVVWGEPYEPGENLGYMKLPLSFTADCSAENFYRFLEAFNAHIPKLKMEALDVLPRKKGLRIRVQVVGFTRLSDKTEG